MDKETQTLVNFTIDGHTVSVPKGTTVYTASKQLGIDIPIFCYQDRMPPFGACRVCLVEVEKMPKLQTSCTLQATEGMVVKTQTQIALEGRTSILEFLLINHPLDCPICDRGGECPLQDQALKHGPGESRFYEEKRHFTKAYPLGPVLMLDRERCIVCARCTRFGDLIAGDHALEFIDRGYKTEVGTPDGGPAQSKFIGNTIMICPVGALTSQVYRFRARPWDNEPTPSTCTLCPVGCSLILDSRDGEIVRTRSNENRDLNDIWLCDKGWFGYEFVTSPERLKQPLMRRDGNLEPASWSEALNLIVAKFKAARPQGKLAAFGGNPLTVEENYLFQKLMREGANANNVDHRIGMPILSLQEEGAWSGMEMTIGDTEKLSYAFLLGLDLTEEFPVIWLRLKQAIDKGANIIYLGHYAPEISKHLSKTIVHNPHQDLDMVRQHLKEISTLAKDGSKGAIFIGSQYLNSPYRKAILSELFHLQASTPNLQINIMEGRGNSMGARFAGMRPDLGPLGEELKTPGLNAIQVLESASRTGWDYLHVAGANPAKKFPSKLWNEARTKLGFLVVQDLFLTETAKQADVVLPTLSFVEKEGSFINIEGRVQQLNPGKDLPNSIYSDAEIFKQIAYKLNIILPIDKQFSDYLKSRNCQLMHPKKSELSKTAPQASLSNNNSLYASFAPALFDHGVRLNHGQQIRQLAKKPTARLHPKEGAKLGLNNGDRVHVHANNHKIPATLEFDEGVALNTLVLPLGFDEIPVHDLDVHLQNGLIVEIKK